MNTLKTRVFGNWHLTRIIRAAIAILMLYWCIQTRDWGIALVSLVLLAMAVTNTGCCGSQGCYVSTNKSVAEDPVHKTNFEEIN